jgi:putative N6-adenine-specific DNA methylase
VQEEKIFVAKTIQGLEQILAEELVQFGAKDIKAGNRMVEFRADTRQMYSMNYGVYTALRILESFHTFHFSDVNDYYDQIRALPWKQLINPTQTIAVDSTVIKCNAFNHSGFTDMKTKDAVVDYFRDEFGIRPSVNLANPDLLINIYIQSDFCHVSLDTSGTPLFKRGYREMLHEASINEVLAAGLIRLSGWNGEGHFYDPMCGGATIPIESAMFAGTMPSGFFREKWGFMNWKTYDPDLWKEVKTEMNAKSNGKIYNIIASDISAQSLRIARKNIASARMMKRIQIRQTPFEKLLPETEKGILIFNPPYNVRMEVQDMVSFYQGMGNHLKHHFKGHHAWIISSDMNAMKHIGLKPAWKYHLMNGPLEARFHGFDLY